MFDTLLFCLEAIRNLNNDITTQRHIDRQVVPHGISERDIT